MCCAVVLHDTATAASGVTVSQVSTHLLKAKGKLISGVNVSMEFCSLTVSTSPWGRCTFNEGMADSPIQRPSCQPSAHLCVFSKEMINSPICSKTVLSNFCPSTGSSSIFQSPVCTMLPCSLRRMRPQQSGMEFVTLNGEHLKQARHPVCYQLCYQNQ